jgi:hypothetical protein
MSTDEYATEPQSHREKVKKIRRSVFSPFSLWLCGCGGVDKKIRPED